MKIGYECFLTLGLEHEGHMLEDIFAAGEHVEGLLK